jgi:chaperone required for assembly of F1-ATPase
MVKRFFEQAEAVEKHDGFGVRLDRHELKTPARRELRVPTRALADALAAEWQNSGAEIDTMAMPLNRLVNTALDRVTDQYDATVAQFVAYGETDLLCYRATHPDSLVNRQNEVWNTHLAWAENRHRLHFRLAEGIQPVRQTDATLSRLHEIAAYATPDPLRLTGLVQAASLLGSAVLALAVTDGAVQTETAYQAAFLDELYQIEQWGADEEATQRLAHRREEIAEIIHYCSLYSAQLSINNDILKD